MSIDCNQFLSLLGDDISKADPNLSSSREFVQQLLRFFQIERVEAFGEPAVDRSEKIAGLIRLYPKCGVRDMSVTNSCRLGVSHFHAAVAAGVGSAYWRMARHVAVQQALSNAFFESIGLPRLAAPPTA